MIHIRRSWNCISENTSRPWGIAFRRENVLFIPWENICILGPDLGEIRPWEKSLAPFSNEWRRVSAQKASFFPGLNGKHCNERQRSEFEAWSVIANTSRRFWLHSWWARVNPQQLLNSCSSLGLRVRCTRVWFFWNLTFRADSEYTFKCLRSMHPFANHCATHVLYAFCHN